MQILVELVVADVQRFLSTFHDTERLLLRQGAKDATIFCDVELANRISILTEWEAPGGWERIVADADVRRAMRLAGVVGKVRLAVPPQVLYPGSAV